MTNYMIAQSTYIHVCTLDLCSPFAESLASHLKLKKYPQCLQIEVTFGGTSRYYVQTMLESNHDSSQHTSLKARYCLPSATKGRHKQISGRPSHIRLTLHLVVHLMYSWGVSTAGSACRDPLSILLQLLSLVKYFR